MHSVPFSFWVTRTLTDRGSCFTVDAFETACEQHAVQHRKDEPMGRHAHPGLTFGRPEPRHVTDGGVCAFCCNQGFFYV
jgi:hypothetical protein